MEYEATQPVYFPVTDFLELELHLLETRRDMKPDTFIRDLVKRWMAKDIERLGLRPKERALRGFQWKSLFLPDGTVLRTNHGDKVEFAKVSGDHIISDDGTKLTPSLFANRHAKGRNAWRFVWLRFPGDECWVRAEERRVPAADTLRKQSATMRGASGLVDQQIA